MKKRNLQERLNRANRPARLLERLVGHKLYKIRNRLSKLCSACMHRSFTECWFLEQTKVMDQGFCKVCNKIPMLNASRLSAGEGKQPRVNCNWLQIRETVKAWNRDWYIAFVCHLLRQSANVFSHPGMCTALSMMLLTAYVSHNSRK